MATALIFTGAARIEVARRSPVHRPSAKSFSSLANHPSPVERAFRCTDRAKTQAPFVPRAFVPTVEYLTGRDFVRAEQYASPSYPEPRTAHSRAPPALLV